MKPPATYGPYHPGPRRNPRQFWHTLEFPLWIAQLYGSRTIMWRRGTVAAKVGDTVFTGPMTKRVFEDIAGAPTVQAARAFRLWHDKQLTQKGPNP